MDDSSEPRLRLHLRQLEVFIATARGGSTRAAASRISRSQSAASAALVELEEALGAKLFDRVGRRLILNENGRALLPKALWLVDHAASVQDFFSVVHRSMLRISASSTIAEYILPPVVAQFIELFPGTSVRMTVGNTSEAVGAVACSEADIGFIEGSQSHRDVVARPWLTDELVVVASPANPLAGRRVSCRELQSASWAAREQGSGTREFADQWLREHVGQVDVGLELGSTGAIKQLVAAGNAISCLPRYAVARALQSGRLIELDLRLPRAERRLSIIVRREKQLDPLTESFVRHCAGGEDKRTPASASVQHASGAEMDDHLLLDTPA